MLVHFIYTVYCHIVGPILMVYTLYDVVCYCGRGLWGLVDIAAHFGGQIPRNLPKTGLNRHFPAKPTKRGQMKFRADGSAFRFVFIYVGTLYLYSILFFRMFLVLKRSLRNFNSRYVSVGGCTLRRDIFGGIGPNKIWEPRLDGITTAKVFCNCEVVWENVWLAETALIGRCVCL